MSWARRIAMTAAAAGVNVKTTYWTLRNAPRFVRSLFAYGAAANGAFPLRVRDMMPILSDFQGEAGAVSVYFWQDLWAARKIIAASPSKHVDVGSRIDGFVGHLLCHMPVEVVDVRPLTSSIPGLTFVQEDATAMARFASDSLVSLSSLHAVEHFGLGRYGDPVDPEAWLKACQSFQRVLARGGTLYFSVPVGRERVCFNAHRVFSPRTIIDAFDGLQLVSFSGINDDRAFELDADLEQYASLDYGCGLFEFEKRA